jgi:putative peptidoglycan lipid II flippase
MLAMLSGYAFVAAVAFRLGTSPAANALAIAQTVPNFLNIIFGFWGARVLVPVFVEWRVRGTVGGNVLRLLIFVGVASAGVVIAALPFVDRLAAGLAPGLSNEELDLATRLLRLLMPTAALMAISGVLQSVCTSLSMYRRAALVRLLPSSLGCVGVLIGQSSQVAVAAAVGVGVGHLAGAVILIATLLSEFVRQTAYCSERGAWRELLPIRRRLLPLIPFLSLEAITVQATVVAASWAAGGTVAALNYAAAIYLACLFVAGRPIATIATTIFSQQEQRAESANHFWSAIRTQAVIAFPVAIGCAALAPVVVAFALARGSFDNASIPLTAALLRGYSFGLVTHAVLSITVTFLWVRRQHEAAILGKFVSTTILVGTLPFAVARFGAFGITATLSGAYAVECALALFFARRFLRLTSAPAIVAA